MGLDPAKPAQAQPIMPMGPTANNFIYKTSSVSPDVAIAIFDSPQTTVHHNTVLVNGSYPNSIEYRFSGTTGLEIKNNLTDAAITARDGATGTVASNVTNASPTWFISPATGDLHLKQTATSAIDKAVVVAVINATMTPKLRSLGFGFPYCVIMSLSTSGWQLLLRRVLWFYNSTNKRTPAP